MWKWLSELFKPKPEPVAVDRYVEVGKALIDVELYDGRQFKAELVGQYLGVHYMSERDWVISASDRFAQWQRHGGETGTISVSQRLYVPLCHVKDISVQFVQHQVKA